MIFYSIILFYLLYYITLIPVECCFHYTEQIVLDLHSNEMQRKKATLNYVNLESTNFGTIEYFQTNSQTF